MNQNKVSKGRWGEKQAAIFLQQKNFEILYRNWRAGKGEIDLITRENDCLVFVEVKMGQSDQFGPPELRITPAKKRQLYRVAQLFMQEHPEIIDAVENTRFDVVVIDGSPDNFQTRHFENAFMI